jgi:tetratricopeptide (TPR) repeat protein
MGVLDKWFVLGRHAGFDAALGAYDRREYAEAAHLFETFLEEPHFDPLLERTSKLCLAESLNRLGDQASHDGDLELVVAHLERAVALQPRFADLRYKLAKAYLAIQDHGAAHAELDEAIKINERFVEAHLLKAVMLYEQERCEEAMIPLMDAIQFRPSLEDSHYQDFVLLHNGGKNEEALQVIRAMLDAPGSMTSALIDQANATLTGGDAAGAADQYLRLIESVPGYPDVRAQYGQCLLQLDRVDAAIEQLEEAVRINPKFVDALAALGVAYRRSGDPERAKEMFRRALDLVPDQVVALAEMTRLRS